MPSQLFKFGSQQDKSKLSNPTGSERQEKPEMSTGSFIELRDTIYKLCGIYYTDSKKYLLEGRIARRLTANKLKTFEEYNKFLNSHNGRNELEELFEAITINETYFFRAPHQFEALERVIVPEIMSQKSKQSFNQVFRIWSAACSSGEEPYTLALIVLDKLKPLYPNVQFQIIGTDINNEVLEKARRGVFKEYAIRNVPPHIMKKYFKQEGSNYILSNEVKGLVKFMNVNLYDPIQMRSMTGCDVIFCANVLIYFNLPSKQQVVSHLYNSLNKNGYLFIGYSESLHGVSKAFKLIHLPKAMAYKKE